MENTKHRTQVSLEQWQYQRLVELSRRTKRSLSAIIRDLISEKFPAETVDKKGDPLTKVIGMAAGDGSPVARNHDRFLYGKKG